MLLSVTDARQRLLDVTNPKGVERVPIRSASGRFLGEVVRATSDLPPFTNSAMDGFALRSADGKGTFEVVEDIPAGTFPRRTLGFRQAARIMTGAPLPDGGDAVVPVEDTDFNVRDAGTLPPDFVEIHHPPQAEDNVRRQASDLCKGDDVLLPGVKLGAIQIGMLAMLGYPDVLVSKQPLVAILPTGDELLPPGAPLTQGKIYESNGHTLEALVRDAGANPLHLGIALDDEASVEKHLDGAVEAGADLILTSAGVSVGAFDYVRSVVETRGKLNFWRVNMRPGKPLVVGEYRGIPLVGLPGNPVSSFVGFQIFVKPALLKMLGAASIEPVRWKGVLAEPVTTDGRESYLRATFTRSDEGYYQVRLTGPQGSGNHHSLVLADGLMVIPAGVRELPIGAVVDILPF